MALSSPAKECGVRSNSRLDVPGLGPTGRRRRPLSSKAWMPRLLEEVLRLKSQWRRLLTSRTRRLRFLHVVVRRRGQGRRYRSGVVRGLCSHSTISPANSRKSSPRAREVVAVLAEAVAAWMAAMTESKRTRGNGMQATTRLEAELRVTGGGGGGGGRDDLGCPQK